MGRPAAPQYSMPVKADDQVPEESRKSIRDLEFDRGAEPSTHAWPSVSPDAPPQVIVDLAPLDALGSFAAEADADGPREVASWSPAGPLPRVLDATRAPLPSAPPALVTASLATNRLWIDQFWQRRLPIAAVLGALLLTAFFGLRRSPLAGPASTQPEAMGSAQFDSRPSGAEVVIDGVVRGRTPLRVTLPVGQHALEIRGAGGLRALPLTVEEGVLASHYIEIGPATELQFGRLQVTSDPPGAEVELDGIVKGETPLELDGVPAGEHNVTLTNDETTVRRAVTVGPGATASVAVQLATPEPAAPAARPAIGWLVLKSPFEVRVLEADQLVGTAGAERLPLPVGRHELHLVNTDLEFRETAVVDIRAGTVTTTAVTVPNGVISVNALPWAEVFVDGQSAGTTPLANLTLPVGRHDVVWRHPELGERRQRVSVPVRTPLRVSVDFRP
mgnify:CR=1 FL=1